MFALLIIDQQQGIDAPELGARNNPNAQSTILALLSHWRQLNWPVIHVRHNSHDIHSVFWAQKDSFNFKPAFVPDAREHLIEKRTPCAFTATALAQLLDQLHVEALVITGASTNNSVEATARSAGNFGYRTLVVEDACFAFDKRDYAGVARSAEEVHNMSLANLDGEYATVLSHSELLSQLNTGHQDD
ncbi:MAG: cysteine hydrolase family protein [Pseudomonadales bacterium]